MQLCVYRGVHVLPDVSDRVEVEEGGSASAWKDIVN